MTMTWQLFLSWVSPQDFNRYLYTHVHSHITHSGQKVEATQMSKDRGNKMWYAQITEYYSSLKRKEILFCYNMDKPCGQNKQIKQNKPVTKHKYRMDPTHKRYT